MISNSSSVKSCLRYSTKMKILSFIFAVFLTVSVSALPGVSARANQEKVKSNNLMTTKPNKSPFEICIDDSDCLKLGQGDKYACFQVRNENQFLSFVFIGNDRITTTYFSKNILRKLMQERFT